MLPTLYRGSVKDVLGPVEVRAQDGAPHHSGHLSVPAVVFDYTDAFSVFDWGRMPDYLSGKGSALAVLAAHWFEQLENPDHWREFSKSIEAQGLRKGNRFGAVFNELGESLQSVGLRTHYVGAIDESSPAHQALAPKSLQSIVRPPHKILVKQVSAVKPAPSQVLGRALPDYAPTLRSPYPRLVPLEVVFRFSCPDGSSLLERIKQDPEYLIQRGFAEAKPEARAQWEFPVLELFTKLESTDRPVGYMEAMAISGLSAPQLQELLLQTAWVAGFLRASCRRAGVELADGKLEWGIQEGGGQPGSLMLVDAVGPDELRILKDGIQLSKEYLRKFYRATSWYSSLSVAKDQAIQKGQPDWKRLVTEKVPLLPADQKELASQIYRALANRITGRSWFDDAWSLEDVIAKLRSD